MLKRNDRCVFVFVVTVCLCILLPWLETAGKQPEDQKPRRSPLCLRI